MKRMLCLLLIFLLAFSGCQAAPSGGQSDITPGETPVSVETPAVTATEPPKAPSPTPEEVVVDAEPVVHEFGTPDAIISNDEQFSVLLMYPATELQDVDRVLKAWADALYEKAKQEMNEILPGDAKAEVELLVHFNSYQADERFVGIEELGMYTTSHQAHPEDIVYTCNVDTKTGTVLENASLFYAEKEQQLLSMLHEKLTAVQPDLALIDMDASWLAYPVLMKEGVAFHLPRGYLASAYGMQSVFFAYEELEGILSLPEEEAPVDTFSPSQEVPLTPAVPSEVNPALPMVALTFDDGPSVTTPKILALLDQYGGKATFCMIGNRVSQYSETVKMVVAQGSEIASHTWSHKKLTKLSKGDLRSELQAAQDALVAVGAPAPRWLRPPYGSVNDSVKEVAAEFSYGIVNWSIDTEDWKTRNADTTYQRIMNEVKDGSIILCHDLHAETGKAMERVIPALVERGYQLVTVTELLEAKGVAFVPGKLYRHP
ncbi:polysaccharide deacetylase family protein [Christensenellaceae bacterium OttesenSCG-928-L17]|nr:polysaccharide deacetylase family protein [Christensenellaceae bacterium OttesenSCG-928-L17]